MLFFIEFHNVYIKNTGFTTTAQDVASTAGIAVGGAVSDAFTGFWGDTTDTNLVDVTCDDDQENGKKVLIQKEFFSLLSQY